MPEIRIELPAETLESIRIDQLLLEGLDSGPARPMTPSDWEELRRRIHERNRRAD